MSGLPVSFLSCHKNEMKLCSELRVQEAGGGVQINKENVTPWREKHPQVCLHLAYILPIRDFPTPDASPAAESYYQFLKGVQKQCSSSSPVTGTSTGHVQRPTSTKGAVLMR